MIGERENIYPDTNYGTLVMHAFDIDGNDIHAFYDSADNLVFVLDNTINSKKPNVLLVINPDGDKKWDEILSTEYGVDLETIRPKVDNKYQKLDIEYSGLSVYEAIINAYKSGDDLEEHLNQLAILRDSAARHSAMMRLNVANETISKTNMTIVKTKETIVRLQVRIKTLRSKLSSTKKEIGKVSTKQSAAKILKLESQIEAANEKLKRAKKRLEAAQKRLEAATVDAELSSDLLNQDATEIKHVVKNKPVMVAPEYPVQATSADTEEDETGSGVENTEVKPLFSEDPQILDEDIAFKPITFDAPVFNEVGKVDEPAVADVEYKPVLESMTQVEEPAFIPVPIAQESTEFVEEKPVLESITPVEQPQFTPVPDIPEIIEEQPMEEKVEEKPVIETIQPVVQDNEPVVKQEAPVSPVVEPVRPVADNSQMNTAKTKPGAVYYLLLFVLILLSVFTLWLYQRHMSTDTMPVLTARTVETATVDEKPAKQVEQGKVVEEKAVEVKAVEEKEDTDDVFLGEDSVEETAQESAKPEKISEPEPVIEEVEQQDEVVQEEVKQEEIIEEPVVEETDVESPVVIDGVPDIVNTSVSNDEELENIVVSEEDVLATKPVYEPGAKYDDMFVSEEDAEIQIQPDESESLVVETEEEFID